MKRDVPVSDVKEIFNYVRAMEHGVKRLRELPISSRLTCEIHEILMKGVRGEGATPGLMRTSQNWIGSPGCTLMDATYVPPPVPEMKSCFSDLEKYISFQRKGTGIDFNALWFIISLRRFTRLLMEMEGSAGFLLRLCYWKRSCYRSPSFILSDFFEKHRDEYYKLLLNVKPERGLEGLAHIFLKRGSSTVRKMPF